MSAKTKSGSRPGRVEGRRSLSAYVAASRGELERASAHLNRSRGRGDRGVLVERTTSGNGAVMARVFAFDGNDTGAFSAGIALALVLPLLGTRRAREMFQRSQRAKARMQQGPDKGNRMKRKPSIKSIDTVTLDEAKAYIEFSGGDELNAAWLLATDRNRLDGSPATPDDAEVHHALFLLCRARGLEAPSFDEMRVRLRARVAA